MYVVGLSFSTTTCFNVTFIRLPFLYIRLPFLYVHGFVPNGDTLLVIHTLSFELSKVLFLSLYLLR